MAGKRGPLEYRFWLHVDKAGADKCWLWTSGLNGRGYGQIRAGRDREGNRKLKAHRVSYELAFGPIPEGMHIDHICRVRHCVNPHHLRPVTNAQNAQHRSAVGVQGTSSRYRGVTWLRRNQKWMARVMVDGRMNYLGLFEVESDAARAARAFRRRHMPYSALDLREGLDKQPVSCETIR